MQIGDIFQPVRVDQINWFLYQLHGAGAGQGSLFMPTNMPSEYGRWSKVEPRVPDEAIGHLGDEDGQLTGLVHGQHDVYVSVCRFAGDSRKAADASWVPGVWLDIDVKPTSPTSIHSAAELDQVMSSPHWPKTTMEVSTGSGGRHAYWLLHTGSSDIERMKMLIGAWIAYTSRLASVILGREIRFDRLRDLARVMRMPGTLNWKYGDPLPVVLHKAQGPRYTLDELEAHIPDQTWSKREILFSGSGQPPPNHVSVPDQAWLDGAADDLNGYASQHEHLRGATASHLMRYGNRDAAIAFGTQLIGLYPQLRSSDPWMVSHVEKLVDGALEKGMSRPSLEEQVTLDPAIEEWAACLTSDAKEASAPKIRSVDEEIVGGRAPAPLPSGEALTFVGEDSDRWPSPMNPAKVAVKYLQHPNYRDDQGRLLIRRWNQEWMRYTGTHWELRDPEELKSEVDLTLENAYFIDDKGNPKSWMPTRPKINNVLDSIGSRTFLNNRVNFGSWTDDMRGAPENLISCQNVLLHPETKQTYYHDPRYFTGVSVAVNWDPNAQCPQWEAFLESLWPGDEESKQLLQEWFGYVISGDTSLQKIFLMVGKTRSGKGVIADILTALMGGVDEVPGVTMEQLREQFGLETLLGKSLAIIGDARISRDKKALIERLLTISGDGQISVNRKNRLAIQTKLQSRFMILSNEVPQLRDESGAMANRFIPLHFPKSFLGREDPTLRTRLMTELPGILRWSLDGLQRLRTLGWSMPETSAQLRQDVVDSGQMLPQFVADEIEFYDPVRAEDHAVLVSDVFERWKIWCDKNNHPVGNSIGFGIDMHNHFDGLRAVQRVRTAGGKRERVYLGLKLVPRADDWIRNLGI